MESPDIWTTIITRTLEQIAIEGEQVGPVSSTEAHAQACSSVMCDLDPFAEPSLFSPPSIFEPSNR